MKKNKFLGFVLLLQFSLFALLNGFDVLSTDDIGTLQTTSIEFSKVWQRAMEFEQQAPLYFILLNVWRTFSDSLFWAKLFNYLLLAGSTIFFYKIAAFYFPEKKSRYLVLLFFALHPFFFFISNDLRRYSLTLFFSLVTLFFTLKIFITNSWKKRDYFFLILFCVLGVLNDYFHAFLLAGLGGGLLFEKNKKKWLYFLAMIPAVITFLILFKTLLSQLQGSENWHINFIEQKVVFYSLRHAIHLIESQAYPLSFTGFGFAIKMLFRIVFVFLIGFPIFKELSKNKIGLSEIILKGFHHNNRIIFLPALTFIIIYIVITIVFQSTYYLLPRYMGFSFPIIFLGFALVVKSLSNIKPIYYRNTILLILLVLYLFNYYGIYKNKNLHQLSFKLISEQVAEELPKIKVFVLDPKNAEMINYYINDSSKEVIGVPNKFDYEFYDYSKRFIKSEEQIRALFELNNQKKDTFLLVSTINAYDSNQYNSNILKEYLNKNYELKSEEQLHGFYVMKYYKK